MKIDALYNLFFQHPEGGWIMRPENARRLHQFVKGHDVKRVLDLGTGIGCSTALVAAVLKEKGIDYHIDTVEQYDKCIALAKQLIPQEYQEKIGFHKADAVVWQTEKIPYRYFSVYDKLPEGDYDLWINDGPSDIPHKDYYVDLPNGTVIQKLFEDKVKPGTFILFDGRKEALRTVERYFGANFYITNPGEHGHDVLIIERKDNPFHFEDDKKIVMEKVGFFQGLPSLT